MTQCHLSFEHLYDMADRPREQQPLPVPVVLPPDANAPAQDNAQEPLPVQAALEQPVSAADFIPSIVCSVP